MEWEKEAVQIAQSYAGSDFDKPREIERTAFSAYSGDEWHLPDFIQLLSETLEAIPKKYRATAVFEFEGGGYDESGSIKVKHDDVESQKEVSARVARCWEYVCERRAKERADFERLKAKYEA